MGYWNARTPHPRPRSVFFFAIALLTETSRGKSTVFASARPGHHASRRLLGLAIIRRSRAAALLLGCMLLGFLLRSKKQPRKQTFFRNDFPPLALLMGGAAGSRLTQLHEGTPPGLAWWRREDQRGPHPRSARVSAWVPHGFRMGSEAGSAGGPKGVPKGFRRLKSRPPPYRKSL